MTDRHIELIALVCSRLCHDLIGPVGAIGNGVELLAEEDDADLAAQAVELLNHSVGQASGRLQFYRLAFGAGGGAGGGDGLGDARRVAEGYFAGSRVRLDWPESALDLPAGAGTAARRLLLNLVLLAAESLPRGGVVRVAATAAVPAFPFQIEAEGQGVALQDGARQALQPGQRLDDVIPKLAPAVLAADLAASMHARVAATGQPDRLVLGLVAA